jgi:guanyl-specific ribonuclease Sa
MTTINTNAPAELPSSQTLLRSTLIALAVAATLLVTVVLPAEYAIDPTGIGRVLGLTQMGQIKMSLAQEAAAAEAAEAALLEGGAAAAVEAEPGVAAASDTTTAPASRSDVTTITLRPNEGKEVKLEMQQGAAVRYNWSVEGGVVNYDTHGDPWNAPREFYHGYGKGTATPGHEGELVAAFDGLHGWFWRNRTGSTVTVTLRTEGAYQGVRGP